MANVKITELPSAGTLTGTEEMEVVQGGANKRAPLSAHPISTAVAAALAGKSATSHTHTGVYDPAGTAATAIAAARGAAEGLAPLGSDSKVPSAYLPSYVDDVLEYANYAALPGTGETGKIYIAMDTGAQYRWSGSAYVQLVGSPGSTDAVPEGSTNLYHTTGRAAAAAPVQSVIGLTGTILAAALKSALALVKGDVGLGNVDNTSDANKPVSTAAQTALNGKRSIGRWIEFDTPEFVKYVSSTSIKIAGSGRAVVNGTLLEWESDITWSGSSGSAPLAAAGMVYGYLYDSGGGTAALEVSTTAPEFNATHKYWRKTGDSSRRCVWAGYVWATTTPTYRIVPFIAMWQSGSAEIIYESEYIDASNRFALGSSLNVVSAGVATTPTAFTLTHVAQHASHWYVSSKLTFVSANDDSIGIITHSSWTTTGAAADAPLFSVRNTSPVAGSRTYFGRAWLPVRTARTAYYCLQHVVGTTSNIYIEDPGFRIPV